MACCALIAAAFAIGLAVMRRLAGRRGDAAMAWRLDAGKGD